MKKERVNNEANSWSLLKENLTSIFLIQWPLLVGSGNSSYLRDGSGLLLIASGAKGRARDGQYSAWTGPNSSS